MLNEGVVTNREIRRRLIVIYINRRKELGNDFVGNASFSERGLLSSRRKKLKRQLYLGPKGDWRKNQKKRELEGHIIEQSIEHDENAGLAGLSAVEFLESL